MPYIEKTKTDLQGQKPPQTMNPSAEFNPGTLVQKIAAKFYQVTEGLKDILSPEVVKAGGD
jgi:hypothetical protein